MLRTWRLVASAGLLVVGSLITITPAATAAPAVPAAVTARAVTPMACGAMSTGAVFGGYRSRMVCDSRQIDGFGTTAAAAQQNVNAMYSVAVQTGSYCMTAQLPRGVDGGYRVSMACNSRAVDGHGTTLTDAGNNASSLALLGGRTGIHCMAANLQRPTGGFRLALACNSRAVENHGSTLTAAASNVTGLAQIGGDTGVWCASASLGPVAGGQRTTLSCNSRAVHGMGSDLTAMGGNAYGFAVLSAYHGRHCGSSGSQPITGGYRATFTCVPSGTFSGQGATLSVAAANALSMAQ